MDPRGSVSRRKQILQRVAGPHFYGRGDGRFASLGFGSLSPSSRARLAQAAHVVTASAISFFGAFLPTRSASLFSLIARPPSFLFSPFFCSTEEPDPLLEPGNGRR